MAVKSKEKMASLGLSAILNNADPTPPGLRSAEVVDGALFAFVDGPSTWQKFRFAARRAHQLPPVSWLRLPRGDAAAGTRRASSLRGQRLRLYWTSRASGRLAGRAGDAK